MRQGGRKIGFSKGKEIRRTSEVTGESGTVHIEAEEARVQLLQQTLSLAQQRAILTRDEAEEERKKIEKLESILDLVKEEE